MSVEALSCPSCGAPLSLESQRATAACVYCNVPLVVTRDASGHGELAPDEVLDPEFVEKLKGLLHGGRRDEAITLYRERTGRDLAAAEQAIDDYASNIVSRAIFSTTLNTRGWIYTALAIVFVVGGPAIAVAAPLWMGLGVVLTLVGAAALWLFGRAAVRSLRYTRARVARARVLRYGYVGSRGPVHTYRLHLHIEDDARGFETELVFPVAESGRAKLREGFVFWVKYFPNEPDSVLFHRHIEST